MRTLATTSAAFLHHAFDLKTKRFHNHLSFDRRWLDEQGSEDCQGRALWALGIGVGRSPFRSFQMMAGQLFALALPALTGFTSPRAWAFGLIGIHEYLRRLSGDSLVNQTRETLTCRLMELFEASAHPDWQWFEEELSYDNAKLAHALIVSGHATGQPAVLAAGPRGSTLADGIADVREGALSARLAATGSTAAAARAPISTSSPLRRRQRSRPVWKPIAPHRTSGGMNRRSALLTGSSAGTISDSNSTLPRQAAAAMGCMWIGSTGTRERNPPWPSCFRWRKCNLAQNMLTSFQGTDRHHGVAANAQYPCTSNVQPRFSIPTSPAFFCGPSVRVVPSGSARIVARIMALPEDRVGRLLDEVSAEFSQRHQQIRNLFLERFEQVRESLAGVEEISEPRRLLIGSYFLAEYSLESAALFNPSIVPHPDQTGLPPGALRFILSLRATGEGHISSITFRTGIIHPDQRIEVLPPTGFLTEPRQIPNPRYEKALFGRKLSELGLTGEFTRRVMNRLGESFALEDLRAGLQAEQFRLPDGMSQEDQDASQGIWMLARSNYEVQFQPEQQLSERIIVPGHALPTQRHRGRPLRSLPERRRHPHLLRDLHRLRWQGRRAGIGGDFRLPPLSIHHPEWSGRRKQRHGDLPAQDRRPLCHALPPGQREHLPDVFRQRPLLE